MRSFAVTAKKGRGRIERERRELESLECERKREKSQAPTFFTPRVPGWIIEVEFC